MLFSLLWTPSSSSAAFERCSVDGCSLVECLGLAILQSTCGMYSTGSQFSSASTIGSHLLSGIVFLLRLLLRTRSMDAKTPIAHSINGSIGLLLCTRSTDAKTPIVHSINGSIGLLLCLAPKCCWALKFFCGWSNILGFIAQFI